MHPARIAELLQPFLSPTPNPCHSATDPCHSEQGQRPGEEPAVLAPATAPCHSQLPKAGEESAVLSATQLQSISTYIDILLHWNARINLTAVRTPEEIVTRHFGESLFAARHLFPPNPVSPSVSPVPSVVKDFEFDFDFDAAEAPCPTAEARVADVGSGAGFPGVPIKLWAPNIALTLIESNLKKAAFLRELARTLTLTDINIQNARAETLSPATFDAVTLRAVERLPKVLPVAANLLSPAGRLALLISTSQLEPTRSTLPHVSWSPPIPIPNSQSRILLVGISEPRM